MSTGMTPTPGTLRVGFEKAMRETYERLTTGSSALDAPFRTMKDVFMLAACRGYQLGERRALDAKETPIHWEVFSSDRDVPILKAIAISATGDVAVLSRLDEVVAIAEEYANVGIRDIKSLLLDQYGQPLWSLVNMIRDDDANF